MARRGLRFSGQWRRAPESNCSGIARHFILICVIGASTGCGKVAAYERGTLAHPTMDPNNAVSAGQDHVYAIHEGAVGGTIGVASGCGCN